MRPTIGPLDKPETLDAVIRQVFAVETTMPSKIADALARLAATEERRSGPGAIVSRMRRLHNFDPRRLKTGPSGHPRIRDPYDFDWPFARLARGRSTTAA